MCVHPHRHSSTHTSMSLSYPLSIQQEVHSEAHDVIQVDLLVPVKDLEYSAEDTAIVDPSCAEAAFSCTPGGRYTQQKHTGEIR